MPLTMAGFADLLNIQIERRRLRIASPYVGVGCTFTDGDHPPPLSCKSSVADMQP